MLKLVNPVAFLFPNNFDHIISTNSVCPDYLIKVYIFVTCLLHTGILDIHTPHLGDGHTFLYKFCSEVMFPYLWCEIFMKLKKNQKGNNRLTILYFIHPFYIYILKSLKCVPWQSATGTRHFKRVCTICILKRHSIV